MQYTGFVKSLEVAATCKLHFFTQNRLSL